MSPELKEKVERLCECLTKAMHERCWPKIHSYNQL